MTSAMAVDEIAPEPISQPLKCWECGKVLLAHFVPTPRTELVARCSRCKSLTLRPSAVDDKGPAS